MQSIFAVYNRILEKVTNFTAVLVMCTPKTGRI